MRRYKSEDYMFASAYIRCQEKYLLSSEKAEKMLEAKTPDEALKVLYELNYGDGSSEVSASEFEVLLSQELEKAYNLVLPLAPDREYFVIFLYPNDYHNVKTLLKAEFLGTNADELLMNTGSIPLAKLIDLVQNRNYTDMRLEMAKGIQEVVDTYGTTRNPQVIDLILDKACYKDINIEVSKIKNSFVRGYTALRIDTINLKSFVRAREMSKSWDFFSNIYIEGGNIAERLFISGYDEAFEQFADKLGIYGLSAALYEGASMLKESKRFTALEKFCDNLLMNYIRDAKYIAVGVEPLVAFLAAKENEVKMVRVIMAGKLANLPAEQIRERMRDTYA